MILYINTKDQKKVSVSLKKNGKVVESLSKQNEFGSQVLLPLIMQLLRMHTPGLDSRSLELEGIEVETGPGSYTGLKVGVAVANALGYSLNIPINGKKIETELQY